MKENVLAVINTLTEEQISELREVCRQADYEFNLAANYQQASEHLPQATIIYGGSAKLIANAPKLKWFHSLSAGVNTYIPVLKEETILTNSSGAFGLSIAEHIIMVILMMLRQMPLYQGYTLQHQWKKGFPQESIYGKRITVLGTGNIGSCFAERVRGFKPHSLIGVNRSGRQAELFDACLPVEKLDEILPETDILVCCIPETTETINLLDAEKISLLPETSYIVNVGRGSLIDEEALMNALNSHHLAGAALDVFHTEPLPENSPLYEMENLLITPHCSGNLTLQYTKDINYSFFLTNLKHYIAGEPLEHVVNKKLGY